MAGDLRRRTWTRWVGTLAGAMALASGIAYVAYFFAGLSARDALITSWNLLIIPTAIYVGLVVARRGPILAAISTTAGVVASLLWAFGSRMSSLEPWWIGLAAVWWLGVGWLLRADRRRLALFTLVLGFSAAVDFGLTVVNAPMPIYALGGFKIPLTIVWTFWLGVSLLRDPTMERAGPDASHAGMP